MSDDETRSLKRRKTRKKEESTGNSNVSSSLASALENDVPNAQWTRHAKYYFDDGSIVLSAESTIFRVHKSVLALHSGFFKRLLNQPRESDAETVDGCPLVPLQDSAGRVERLLEVMYGGDTTRLMYQNSIVAEIQSFDAKIIDSLYLLSFIGHKYDIEFLQEYIYQQLRQIFHPQTRYLSHALRHSHGVLEQNKLRRTIIIIRSWIPKATHLLPIIFYCYCQLWSANAAILSYEGPEQLSRADVERCMMAIPRLIERKIHSYSVFTTFSLGTASTLPDPLEDLTEWCSKQLPWKHLCASCAKKLEKEIKQLREATWKDLGKIFDILDWQAGDEPT